MTYMPASTCTTETTPEIRSELIGRGIRQKVCGSSLWKR